MEKDLKDNQPRKSRWLLICFPLMMIMIFTIVLIPLGVFYLKPYLENQRRVACAAALVTSLPAADSNTTLSPSSTAPSTRVVLPAKDLGRWTGTVLDTRTWLDYTDLNTTFTTTMISGLPVMGLYTSWSNKPRANPYLPALEAKWEYGSQPVRGVELKGWFKLEPSLSPWIGESEAQFSRNFLHSKSLTDLKKQIETHYNTFIVEQDFAEIAEAGLDHVRIPIGYWLLRSTHDDPHLGHVGWRYFLRSLEWARKYGLRVSVQLTSDVPVFPDFAKELATQLATFMAQERYKNLVTMLDVAIADPVTVAGAIRASGYNGLIVGQDVTQIRKRMGTGDASYQERVAIVCDSWQREVDASSIVEWDIRDGTAGDTSRPLYRAFLKHYAKAQISIYDSKFGWFFNSWKGSDLRTSYQRGIEAGVLPNFNATGIAMEFICDASVDYGLMGLL